MDSENGLQETWTRHVLLTKARFISSATPAQVSHMRTSYILPTIQNLAENVLRKFKLSMMFLLFFTLVCFNWTFEFLLLCFFNGAVLFYLFSELLVWILNHWPLDDKPQIYLLSHAGIHCAIGNVIFNKCCMNLIIASNQEHLLFFCSLTFS